jgi:hypothetical protein
MGKFLWLAVMGSGLASGVWGQVKKQFSVENTAKCSRVELHLKAKTGNCFIRPSQNSDLLNIYSNQDLEEYNHAFSNEVNGKTCLVKLSLEQEDQKGVSQKISYKVFGSGHNASDKFWKVYLTDNLPYDLDLHYGLGNANIDLSGLSIEKLKINTGSADVNVSYNSGVENRVEMDTFFVNVDMGSLSVRQLNLSRARVVIAEVGFGNILLDFSNKPIVSNHIKGSVGAGNLIITLPDDDVPVLVKINDSWLCSVSTCKSLKKIGDGTFANASYGRDQKNSLTFDLEVSMGKILFKEKGN